MGDGGVCGAGRGRGCDCVTLGWLGQGVKVSPLPGTFLSPCWGSASQAEDHSPERLDWALASPWRGGDGEAQFHGWVGRSRPAA